MWRVRGQDRAVAMTRAACLGDRPVHAYLLVGPPGVGKMRLACDIAMALNCEGEDPPCGECDSCRRIENAAHPDVQVSELEAKSGDDEKLRTLISAEQVDAILAQANLPPFSGRCKVFIIAAAELLSVTAANRLLKTLEEPPPRVVFILLTPRDGLLPETVVSRCQRLELKPAPEAEIMAVLSEGDALDGERAALLARLSHGRLGWALRARDDAEIMAGRELDIERLLELCRAGYEERFAWAGDLANAFRRDRQAIWDRLSLWQDWWRDLMLVRAGCPQAVVNTDYRDTITGQAAGYRLEQLQGFLNALDDCRLALRQNVNPGLALELLMMEIPEVRRG